MPLNTKRSKISYRYVTLPISESQISLCFTLWVAVLSYKPFWDKCTEWPQNDLTLQGQSYPIYMLQLTPSPKFHSSSLYGYFWLTGHFKTSAPKDPKWSWILEGQKYPPHIHTTSTSEAQILVHLALQSAVFELRPSFVKTTLNDIKMNLTYSRLKVPIWILHTPPRLKFSSVSLYDEPFLRYALFLESALNDLKWPWHVQGQKYHYVCFMHPEAQIFVHFTLWWAVFK